MKVKRREFPISDNVAIVMSPNHTLPSGGGTSLAELASSILKGSEDSKADVIDRCCIGKDGIFKNIDPVTKFSISFRVVLYQCFYRKVAVTYLLMLRYTTRTPFLVLCMSGLKTVMYVDY
jgi:hypothetical protein